MDVGLDDTLMRYWQVQTVFTSALCHLSCYGRPME